MLQLGQEQYINDIGADINDFILRNACVYTALEIFDDEKYSTEGIGDVAKSIWTWLVNKFRILLGLLKSIYRAIVYTIQRVINKFKNHLSSKEISYKADVLKEWIYSLAHVNPYRTASGKGHSSKPDYTITDNNITSISKADGVKREVDEINKRCLNKYNQSGKEEDYRHVTFDSYQADILQEIDQEMRKIASIIVELKHKAKSNVDLSKESLVDIGKYLHVKFIDFSSNTLTIAIKTLIEKTISDYKYIYKAMMLVLNKAKELANEENKTVGLKGKALFMRFRMPENVSHELAEYLNKYHTDSPNHKNMGRGIYRPVIYVSTDQTSQGPFAASRQGWMMIMASCVCKVNVYDFVRTMIHELTHISQGKHVFIGSDGKPHYRYYHPSDYNLSEKGHDEAYIEKQADKAAIDFANDIKNGKMKNSKTYLWLINMKKLVEQEAKRLGYKFNGSWTVVDPYLEAKVKQRHTKIKEKELDAAKQHPKKDTDTTLVKQH